MFRHKGNARTFLHNFRLAVFLSFTAGIVNICGVLALGVLTTNVTGHFAYFAEDILKGNDIPGTHFLFFILSFLAGSFISSLLTEYYTVKQWKGPHNVAMLLEIIILLTLGLYGDKLISGYISKPLFSCVMLFAMGVQNSIVTKISNSAVRTTHLTGLFTDLGIELSQLFFYSGDDQRRRLLRNIGLRTGIIVFFFLGCITGGFFYLVIKFETLIIATIVLIIALVYDNLRLIFYKIAKRLWKKAPKNL